MLQTTTLFIGAPLVMATTPTTDGGALAAPLTFIMPPGMAAGVYSVTAMDDRGQYPVHWMFIVQ